jgi:hypothetical protein
VATAGTTYYFMVGFCCGNGGTGGGSLTFSVNLLVTPTNDDFAEATPIAALPFSDTVDLAAATTEPSEPSPTCVGLQDTAWYSFTAAIAESLTARVDHFGAGIGVYTGTSLTNLSQVGCSYANSPVLVRAQANTTYYIQVGAWCCDGFGPVTFQLGLAPNPEAGFFFYPDDPSIFDPVQFQDGSTDPAAGVISSHAWSFGDGRQRPAAAQPTDTRRTATTPSTSP